MSGCYEEKQEQTKNMENTNHKPQVALVTSMGEIVIELDGEAAPVSTENFLAYVNAGFFDGKDGKGETIFHRVIPNFMIQGGGFTPAMKQKKTNKPIVNEASNGLKNDRGTIAMARTNNPNSATCQFFINVKDNDFLNYAPGNPGYAVFGKVIKGMETVDAITAVKTGNQGSYQDVPSEPVMIQSAKVITE
jgi:cyclophilin family peptidyl-prolyl cis-trans isomerase